jgi:ABC-type lipoprotein release transport system permease subunit
LFVGAHPRDPITLAVVTAFLVVTMLVATVIPARRATTIDPAVTLRAE